jgi:hypothetical protein
MNRFTIHVAGIFLSFAICIMLLFAGFDCDAYTRGENESSAPALQLLLPDTCALPLTLGRVAEAGLNSAETNPWKVEFTNRPEVYAGFPVFSSGYLPTSVIQKGIYRGESYSLIAELGNMEINRSPVPSSSVSYKGGRISFRTEHSGHSLLLSTFTATSDRFKETLAVPRDTLHEDMVAGVSGELGVFADKVRIGTSYVTGTDTTLFPGKEGREELGKGNRTGIFTHIDPFAGGLVADAEFNFSNLESDTPDKYDASCDRGYALKLGGKTGSYGYEVGFKDPVPEYSIFEGEIVRDHRKVFSIGSRGDFGPHSLVINLSRSSARTQATTIFARSLANEGALSYTYKGIKVLPLGLEYRKRFSTETYGSESNSPNEYESDSISGNVRYVSGFLDWGLRGTFSQLTDHTTKKKEQTTSALSFQPRLVFTDITISPDVSINRSNCITAGQRVDTYSFKLGAKRCNKKEKVDYEVNGGLTQTVSNPTDGILNIITGNLRISAPFLNFFTLLGSPSLNIKGEYSRDNGKSPTPGQNDFTLFISLINI